MIESNVKHSYMKVIYLIQIIISEQMEELTVLTN